MFSSRELSQAWGPQRTKAARHTTHIRKNRPESASHSLPIHKLQRTTRPAKLVMLVTPALLSCHVFGICRPKCRQRESSRQQQKPPQIVALAGEARNFPWSKCRGAREAVHGAEWSAAVSTGAEKCKRHAAFRHRHVSTVAVSKPVVSTWRKPQSQEMFTQLLERKPEDYLGFLADFIEQKQEEADHAELQNDIDFSSEPGLGEDALPGFAAFPLPDISKHNSIATEVLQAQPELEQLANLRTSTGVSLAQCIKPAVDCPGHPMVKVAGAFAGDAECYSLFQQFFDPLVAALSCGTICNGAPQPSDGDVSKISGAQIDPTGSYVVYTVLEARRNVAGIRMPVCCSREERREVERLLSSARLRGTYLPLRGSKSGKGMAAYQEERLRKVGMLLTEPDSKLKLAAGFGRHWPDARGVFVCDAPGVFIWCNEEDHYRFFARQEGSELKELYERLARAVSSVAEAAASAKQEFAASKLGWLTTCPSRVGAALRVTLTLRIPLLAKAVDLPALCERLHLRCDSSSSAISGNLWQVHSLSSLGVSEVELMNEVIQGCRLLVGLEQRLEQNTCIDSIEALPEVADLAGYPSHFALESYVTRFLLQGQGMVVSPKLFSALFEVRGSKSTPNKKSRFLPHLSPVGTLSPRSR